MKRADIAFNVAVVPMDYVMVIVAGVIAYFLRFQSFVTAVRPVVYALPFDRYFDIVVVMAVGFIAIFALSGLYVIDSARKFLQEIGRIVFACSTATLALIVWIFFLKEELFSSRFIVLAVWVLSIVTVAVGRGVVRIVQRAMLAHGVGVHWVVVVGDGRTAEQLLSVMDRHPSLGLRVVDRLTAFTDRERQRLAALLGTRRLDEVMNLDPRLDAQQLLDLVDWCDEHHVTFKYAPDLFQAKATNIDIATIAGVPIIELKKTPLDGWGKVFKRGFDILTSTILIILTAPIMLVVAVAIKFDSPGPIIYKNRRVAKDGEFNTYKFRSMKIEYCTGLGYGGKQADEYERQLIAQKNQRQGPVYKVLADPRRTRLGRFLERTSLDELLQLFNVFIGNMSLVGPRPHQPREVAQYARHHKQVLAIKPGVTGLAQISGRSDLDFDEEVRLDAYYIENWRMLLDLWILLRTPLAVFTRRSRV
ncbi:MAG: sugar transferase [Patescibacteria group bacterium]